MSTDNGINGPSEPGVKHDEGKLRMDLLLQFPRALQAIAAVGQKGLEEYAENGWASVPNGAARYRAAQLRHQFDGCVGDGIDAKSGQPHAWHEAWNVLAWLELTLRDKESEGGNLRGQKAEEYRRLWEVFERESAESFKRKEELVREGGLVDGYAVGGQIKKASYPGIDAKLAASALKAAEELVGAIERAKNTLDGKPIDPDEPRYGEVHNNHKYCDCQICNDMRELFNLREREDGAAEEGKEGI